MKKKKTNFPYYFVMYKYNFIGYLIIMRLTRFHSNIIFNDKQFFTFPTLLTLPGKALSVGEAHIA